MMYASKGTSTIELEKTVYDTFKLPLRSCKLLSADRVVCLVNHEWIKSLHKGRISPLSGFETLEACKVERLLSRSCEQVPAPWTRISIKAIAKTDEIYQGLPGVCLQKQWACGSLYEFMSHICKENLTNLWIQAHSTLTNEAGHQDPVTEKITFTDLVRKYICRLDPSVFIKLYSKENQGNQKQRESDCSCGEDVYDNSQLFCPGGRNTSQIASRAGSFYTTSDSSPCNSVVPIDALVETEDYFFLVQPYYHFTLRDAVMFSPTILETSYAKSLFVVYQLINAIHSLHNRGLRLGDIRLVDILMGKNMWLRVGSPRINNLITAREDLGSPGMDSASMYITANSPEFDTSSTNAFLFNQNFLSSTRQQVCDISASNELLLHAAIEFMKAEQFKNFEISMLDQIVTAWVHREINNFQYIMILNHLAGRKMGDPNNHPVLPWVLDFSAPDSGYRDLTKSKFRLNKGDGQLDFTYSGMLEMVDEGGHVPHHVSDILSDITYYVYKARRTPKSVLCAHVRSNWVPHEYPLSMQRLQEWTPDECIPEFFTDPTIFTSTHEDLPDLEIPTWSKNAVDFVMQHLTALESNHVSRYLHHWIDLTFGCKLSGPDAIKAKNVHLHLVDSHTHLTSHGIAQLFQEPHPSRMANPNYKPSWGHSPHKLPHVTRGLLTSQLHAIGYPDADGGSQIGEISDNSEAERVLQAHIHMPKSYNPLEDLERCEALLGFKGKVLHVSSPPVTVKPSKPIQFQEEGVTDDMVTLLCLVCEMCLDSQMRMQDTCAPLRTRIKAIRRAVAKDLSNIHRPLQKFVSDMFDSLVPSSDKKFSFSAIFPDGGPPPSPDLLIQSYAELIPFPPYFGDLYACLSQLEAKSQEVERLKRSVMPLYEQLTRVKQLEREKVPILESFLWNQQDYLGPEGLGLVLPYVQDLLGNEFTTVQAAWALFDVTTRELGPAESCKQFLPALTSLLSGELSTAKHIKLYHRSFLIQLIVRLGLKTFLTYFSTLLVEAVAGYKDFSITNRFYPEELLEELNVDRDFLDSTASDREGGGASDNEDESEKIDFSEEKKEGKCCGGDGAEVNHEDGEDLNVTLVDGSHILLEEENEIMEQADDEDGGDLDGDNQSHSSDEDVAALYNICRKKAKDRDSLMSRESCGSADQHSIHSISKFVPEKLDESPNVLDELSLPGGNGDSMPDELPSSNEKLFPSMSHESDAPTPHSSSTIKTSNSVKEKVSRTKSETGTAASDIIKDKLIVSPKLSKSVSNEKYHSQHHDEKNVDDEIDGAKLSRNRNHSKSQPHHHHYPQHTPRQRTTSEMVRSETEDLMLSLSANLTIDGGSGAGLDGESGGSGSGSLAGILNIRDIAADSVKWLSHKLGPALATKFLTRNLVRMMALCYLGQEQMQLLDRSEDPTIKTSRLVEGDRNAKKVLECIAFTTVLYGEQVVLIQCMPTILDMIVMAQKRLTLRSEGGLVAAVVLLTFVIPYLSDTSLMNVMEESIIQNCIRPVLDLVGEPKVCFPSGALSRFVLCHKLIDLLFTLGLRLGLEMTRKFLTPSMVALFETFSKVHGWVAEAGSSAGTSVGVRSGGIMDCLNSPRDVGSPSSDDTYLNIKLDQFTLQYTIGSPVNLNSIKSPPKQQRLSRMHSLSCLGLIDEKEDFMENKSQAISAEKGAQELMMVFSGELAQACYIPLCRIFGSIHMEKELPNEDLIRQLCSQHDADSDMLSPDELVGAHLKEEPLSPMSEDADATTPDGSSSGNIGKNVAVVGNRIHLHETAKSQPVSVIPDLGQFGRGYRHSGILEIGLDDLRSADMDHNKSRHLRGNWLAYWERELGLHERDTMFNFMQIELQTYTGHTSSIRSLHTMDTENCFISASKDKTVRLWSIDSQGDGLTKQTCQFSYNRHKKSVFSVAYVDSCRLVASCDSTVHIWDPYTGMAVNQLESAKYSPVVAVTALPAPSRLVAMATTDSTLRFLDMRTAKYVHEFRCSLSNAGLIRCVVVSPDNRWIAAGFSTGHIYILDVNSGVLLTHWKAHDGEILQLKAFGETRLLSSAFDQTVKLWTVENGHECSPTKSQVEPAHCLAIYRDQLVTATTANRISVYASVSDSTAFSSSKLRSASFKGVLTCMSVLPLNKCLLLGADNGTIRLMA